VTKNQPTLQKTTVTSGSGQMTAPMTILRFAGLKQKLRHTLLAPGQFPGLPGQLLGRLLRRVTFTNFIAVPLAISFCKIDELSLVNLTLHLISLKTKYSIQ